LHLSGKLFFMKTNLKVSLKCSFPNNKNKTQFRWCRFTLRASRLNTSLFLINNFFKNELLWNFKYWLTTFTEIIYLKGVLIKKGTCSKSKGRPLVVRDESNFKTRSEVGVGNQEWIIQRNWQHCVHKTPDQDKQNKKHNTES
jgi:hypothetical protein